MKRIIFLSLALCCFISAFCQSIDERIAAAINGSRWTDLRQLYISQGSSLSTDFLHPLSKFFISHFYNQPDSAISNAEVLLQQYQEDLGGSVSSVVYLLAEDYARIGNYDEASALLHRLNGAIRQAGFVPASTYLAAEQQYHILDSLGGFSVNKPLHDSFL